MIRVSMGVVKQAAGHRKQAEKHVRSRAPSTRGLALLPRTSSPQIRNRRGLEGGELDAVLAIVSEAPATQVLRQLPESERWRELEEAATRNLILKQDILARVANLSRSRA